MSLPFTIVQVHVKQNREPYKFSVERLSRLYKKIQPHTDFKLDSFVL